MELAVPSEILHKVFNFGGLTKTLKCSRCKQFTEHVSVSYAEPERGGLDKAVKTCFDYIPGWPVLIGNLFACRRCNRLRYAGGIFSHTARF
jgi:hypothetical protein